MEQLARKGSGTAMSSSFRKTVEAIAEQMPSRAPCTVCRDSTLLATLSNYGARCLKCYDDFCSKGMRGMSQGFVDGRRDNMKQAEMRRAMK